MDAYIFRAALYCSQCGEQLLEELRTENVQDSGDSDDFPQGPYADGGGEADVPLHCDSRNRCVEAQHIGGMVIGAFLGNPLTLQGVEYVENSLSEMPDSPLVQFWAEYYNIAEDEES